MRPTILVASLPALVSALPSTPIGAYEAAKNIIARAPVEAKAVLKSVTSTGTGCAGNSAAFIFQDDAIVAFDSLVLDSTEATRAKRCLITIDLQLDSAWKYTINKATAVRGYVENEGGSYKVTYTVAGKTVSKNIQSDSVEQGSSHLESTLLLIMSIV
jgi:hypothetical protein